MGKVSIQKAKLLKKENTTSKNGHAGTKLTYLHLKDDGTQKESWVQWINQYLNDDSKKILETLKEGSEFVVVKEESGKYWNFKELRDVKTYQPKPTYSVGGKQLTGGNKGGGYDNLGQQIGNSITNAVNSLGAGKTVDEYKQRALELVLAGDWVRERVEESHKNQHKEEDMSMTQSHNQNMPQDEAPF